jgi:hypothetical protein
MKHAIAFLALLAAVASQAATVQVQHDSSTRLYRVDMQSAQAHNCPSRLDLVAQARFTRGNEIAFLISLNDKAERAVEGAIFLIESALESKPASKADFLAAWDHVRNPENVCLSYGKSSGSVYIEAQNLSLDDGSRSSFEVSAPEGYEITEVVSFK